MKKTLKQLLCIDSMPTLNELSDDESFGKYLVEECSEIRETYISHCADEMCVWFDKIYRFMDEGGNYYRYFKCRVPDGMDQCYWYDYASIFESVVEVYPHINKMERCDYLDHPQQ